MEQNRKVKFKRYIENGAVFLIYGISLLVLAASVTHRQGLRDYVYNYLEISRALQRMFAAVLLISAWHVYKRRNTAWILTVFMLTLNLMLHMAGARHITNSLLMICEILALAVLLIFHQDFTRPSGIATVKGGIGLGCLALAAIFMNTLIGFFHLRHFYSSHPSLGESFMNSLGVLAGQVAAGNWVTKSEILYEDFIQVFDWICVLIVLLMICRPIVKKESGGRREKQHVLELVRKFGSHPSAFLAMEDDKKYFFGKQADGVAAYAVSGDVLVVNGDPVCRDEDFPVFLSELKMYCDKNNYDLVFLATTDRYLKCYQDFGFGHVKCGEEPRFKLDEYNLSGGKVAKVRASINHARKAGLTVKEYKPLEKRDARIEGQLEEISREWLEEKKSGELIFTLGTVGLEHPTDQKYFYAADEQGVIQGFMVFIPFMNKKAYLADVTRRRNHAPGGVLEVILYDAFMMMKEDGVEWGSMGLAPLANVTEEGREDTVAAKLLHFIYENMNSIYGFKGLYKAKEKYNPTVWVPAYFVYSPKIMTPQMAYAIIDVQNPRGVGDYVKSFFRNLKREEQREKKGGEMHG